MHIKEKCLIYNFFIMFVSTESGYIYNGADVVARGSNCGLIVSFQFYMSFRKSAQATRLAYKPRTCHLTSDVF